MTPSALAPLSRRGALQWAGAASLAGLTGCCSMRPFATPVLTGEPPALGTPLKPVVRKAPGAPALCIDAHTHFFNGTDVPVKGYLAGPVAHDLPAPLKQLAELLAPLADELVSIAPTAAEEFNDLVARFGGAALDGSRAGVSALSVAAVADDRARRSEAFYRIVQGSEFERAYNAIKRNQRAEARSLMAASETRLLGPTSLAEAASAQDPGRREKSFKSFSLQQKRIVDAEPYADGLLAFVDHMLSPRWQNLRDYAAAYSSADDAFGIDVALGALVDFDGWLDCPPRSAHDDQVKLHQLISRLSGGYLRPLVAYNPWTDVKTGGAALARVRDAVTRRGFVGVKIYPPNGFYPSGNVTRTGPPERGPSYADLDRVLETLWETCTALGVPVMAHTNQSSGKDAAHDLLGGPPGWTALLARFGGRAEPPVNLGHFGGASNATDWTRQFADLMNQPGGRRIYGDLGFWDALRCRDAGATDCAQARQRLADALARGDAPRRVMYGTDWFMLSTQRDWADYPFELMASLQGLPIAPADFFGLNAQRCFASAALGAAP